MRIKPPWRTIIVLGTLAVFFLIVVAEVMARGPGGGRGGRGGGPRGGHRMGRMHHHRVGPASGGSFTSRRTHRPPRARATAPRTPPRSQVRPSRPRPVPELPPEEAVERREEIRERRAERREDIRDEHWDHYRYRRYREEIGTTYTSDYFDDDYCEAEVVVDGVTYYQCEGVWYRQAYAGGEVTYVVVEGPRSN